MPAALPVSLNEEDYFFATGSLTNHLETRGKAGHLWPDTTSRYWISLNASGIAIHGSVWRGLFRGGRVEFDENIAWDEVKRVVALKKDCLIVDSIRMIFELKTGECHEVHEEMCGWKELVEALPAYLPWSTQYGGMVAQGSIPSLRALPAAVISVASS